MLESALRMYLGQRRQRLNAADRLSAFYRRWCRQRAELFGGLSVAACYGPAAGGPVRRCRQSRICPFCFFYELRGLWSALQGLAGFRVALFRRATGSPAAPPVIRSSWVVGTRTWGYPWPRQRPALVQCLVVVYKPGWIPPPALALWRRKVVLVENRRTLWNMLVRWYRWPRDWFRVRDPEPAFAAMSRWRAAGLLHATKTGVFRRKYGAGSS